MKAYVREPAGMSRAMARVSFALENHASTSIKFVKDESQAAFVILHVIGWEGLLEKIDLLKKNGQRFAIIQYCLRTTTQPNLARWLEVWKEAVLVWSYYDLNEILLEEGYPERLTNFYCSPLGAYSDVFTGSRGLVP